MTPTPTTGEALAARRGVKRYLLSFDAVELILCLAYAAAGARVPYAWEPSDRMGVPHQTVNAATDASGGGGEGAGDGGNDGGGTDAGQVLFDLTFDRSSDGETVSTTLLVILGIVVPLVMQSALSVLEVWLEEMRKHEEGASGGGAQSPEGECNAMGVDEAAGVAESNFTGDGLDRSKSPTAAGGADDKGRYFVLHATICTYAIAIGTTLLFTESVKRYVGYMRPNFYQLCQPEYSSTSGNTVDEGGGANEPLVCNDVLSGDTDVERYQSFPSGHASVAYCGLTLLSLYLRRFFGFAQHQKKSGAVASLVVLPNHLRLRRWFYFVSVLLVQVLAMWIATSRIADQVHFPADVLGGAVLGTGCSVFVDGMF